MLGPFVPLSALLFCMALTASQARMSRRHRSRAGLIWVGGSILGLIISIFGAIALGYLSIALFRLDVLQNGTHGSIAAVAMVLMFSLIMALFQWAILRHNVSAPTLQAFFNAVFGTAAWFALITYLFEYDQTWLGVPLLIVLSTVLGAGLGSLIHKFLN